MAKKIGLSFNRCAFQGRILENPAINGGWATMQLTTVVPEPKQGGGGWEEIECVVPLITNDQKKIDTIQNYIQAERQLYVEGYVKTWEGGFGVVITNIKLGSKTMFDPDAQAQQGGGAAYPG